MKKNIKKKIIAGILGIILIVVVFFIGRQSGVNAASNSSNTITNVSEVSVGTQTIQKKLTSSGQITSANTEKISLSTSKYFKMMCVEEDDTVKKGENILKYTNGTYLTASQDCVITSYSVPETGNICTSDNYVEVQYLNDLKITLNIDESQIQDVKEEEKVEITLSADETKTYTGKITKIDSIGTYASSGTTFSATVEFENDGNIKIGMTASCTVILQEATDVVAVPIAAVQEKDNSKYVIVVKDDGTTENVDIQTGISNDNYVEVTSGLNGGEKVQVIQTITTSSGKSNKSNNSANGMLGGQNVKYEMTGKGETGFTRGGMTGEQMGTPPSGGNN